MAAKNLVVAPGGMTGRPAIRQENGRDYKGLEFGLNLNGSAIRNSPFLTLGKILPVTSAAGRFVKSKAAPGIARLPCILRLHPARRKRDELRHGLKFQLLFDLGPVRFNGFRTQMEVSGDFSGTFATADKFENLELPVT